MLERIVALQSTIGAFKVLNSWLEKYRELWQEKFNELDIICRSCKRKIGESKHSIILRTILGRFDLMEGKK